MSATSNAEASDTEDVAEQLYGAYCGAVGWKNFQGDPLPTWAEFSNDPAKTKQADGWRVVAEKAMEICQ